MAASAAVMPPRLMPKIPSWSPSTSSREPSQAYRLANIEHRLPHAGHRLTHVGRDHPLRTLRVPPRTVVRHLQEQRRARRSEPGSGQTAATGRIAAQNMQHDHAGRRPAASERKYSQCTVLLFASGVTTGEGNVTSKILIDFAKVSTGC